MKAWRERGGLALLMFFAICLLAMVVPADGAKAVTGLLGQLQAHNAARVGASASGLNRLRANDQTTTSDNTGAQALAEFRARAGHKVGAALGTCKTCVYVLERIKKGTNPLLSQVCHDLYPDYKDDYGICHQVLESLSENGNNVRYWLFEGCYKYEIYQAKEWVKPCPSHVMCSVLMGLDEKVFCAATKMEDPFA